ncbi:phosphatidylserine synthase [Aspergillus bombycis]|uniref:CDP-diacylglycerol--serine O-phosphatidyltransferase n=1 Tax=Aspergillus bombycis TaxID=109264 RepID=A0A1F7ZKH9_9EURO|nr:phosphatidylserine synthase [Aspergillus bombycis]OGM39942.1 phosphatidylserine synthase [Aspergillus bombycis]
MSFRGGGRGGFATGANRGGSFGGRGGRGGFQQPMGPPAQVLEMGSFMHACEGEMVCESINPKIPYFNAPIYLENKTPIGKVDEVLGPINQVYFTIKPQEGIVATSFKPGDKVYIGGDKLLPLEKFLPKPKPPPGRIPSTTKYMSRILLTTIQVLLSLRELEVLPGVVLAVVEEALVVVREVDAADLADLAPLEAEAASAVELEEVEASVVEAVASPGEAAEEHLVEVSDVRQSPSCLALSYYGVMGKRELLQELFVSISLCILGGLPIRKGFMSVLSSMRYCLGDPHDYGAIWAALGLMPFGLFFDFMDGKIARWRNKSSLMGQELDSLADLISFGMAPAAAAFALGVRTNVDHLLLAFFVLCGLTRLARFNVTVAVLPKDKTGKSKYFEGTPIPTTLSIAALMAYWVSQGWIQEDLPLGVIAQGTAFEFHPVALLFVLHGCLMVSKSIHIPKP